jgi:hypothetical protein
MTTLAELIALYASDLADNYEAIADRLNAPTVIANPRAGETDEITTPSAITLDGLMALVPPAETAAIYAKLPALITNLQQAIDAGNRQWLGYLLQVAADPTNGAISAQTVAALTPLLTATATIATVQPGTIAGPSLAGAAGLGVVSAAQCQAVLN